MTRRGSQATTIFATILTLTVAVAGLSANDKPTRDATYRLAPPSPDVTLDVEEAWRMPPALPAGPRGMEPMPSLLYNNGVPINDVSDASSHFSLSGDGAMLDNRFVAGAADDFIITDAINPQLNVRITMVRSAWFFFNLGNDPSPNPIGTWTGGAYVIIYENSPLDIPVGQPTVNPINPVAPITFSGPPAAVYFVPNQQIVETPVAGSCFSRFVVDLPVDIVLERNRRYWLSIMPRYPAPPQTAWANSNVNTGFSTKVGFPNAAVEFWSDSGGNFGNFACVDAPPQGTRTDLSFQLFGEDAPPSDVACCNLLDDTCIDMLTAEECLDLNPFTIAFVNATCAEIECPVVTGACCDDTSGICNDNINLFDCIPFGSRFVIGGTCLDLDPPCGTTDIGACCTPDDGCQLLTPTECSQLAGDWFAGDCATVVCPAPNDICINAQVITEDGVYPFTNINTETNGPLDSPGGLCTNITNDIWFRYIATCDGNVTVATCSGTNFDSAINVYQGCFCDTNIGPLLACANNNCGPSNDDATVTFAAVEGECYLIRVGGAFDAEGSGLLVIGCVPAQQGACCNGLGACQLLTESECLMSGGTFTAGAPCSPITCPMPDNDECSAAVTIDEGFYLFDNMGATTSTEDQPGGPCVDINNDIWFRHTVQCDGTLLVSTCGATNYDAALAVYEDDCQNGPSCAPLESLLACDNDACGIVGGPAEVTVTVVTGQCVLIRVGGVDQSTGTGGLLVACIPTGQGACCDTITGCESRLEQDCQDDGDVFTPDTTCQLVSCPIPQNDDCANATDISNGVFDFFTLRTTTDGPAIDSMLGACLDVDNDVWFRYTATCDGDLVISPCLEADYDATVAVYDACVCPADAMDQAACTSDVIEAGCGDGENQNPITLPVVNGNCYLVRIGGVGGAVGNGRLIIGCIPAGSGACCLGPDDCIITDDIDCAAQMGDFTLGEPCSPLTCPALENDNCAGAIEIGDGVVAFDTTDALTDGPLDSPGELCIDVENDIWYTYTATCSGQLRISLCANTMFDAALNVYDVLDCPPTTAPLACDNNGCAPDGPAELAIEVNMGEQFLIRVGGANGAVGPGELLIECTPGVACCTGDADGNGDVTINDVPDLVSALLNPPEMMDESFCPADVNEDGAINGADIATFVELLLTGFQCPGGPIELEGACCFSDGDCQIFSQFTCVSAGALYQGNGTVCGVVMCPQPPPPPVNDLCENAIALACNTQVGVNNTMATTSGTDPEFTCKFNGPGLGVGTVWYTFMAEADSALISTCNSSAPVNDTIVAVYEGMCPTDTSTEIACVEDAGGACGRRAQVCVDGLTIGNLYTIQIASFDTMSRGNIVVDLMCPCPMGACCFPDSSCVEMREGACIDAGGSYQGDSVLCSSNPCPPPPEIACCVGDSNQDGTVDAEDIAALTTALLDPPLAGTPAFCINDVNDDGAVDGADIAAFLPLALAETVCPPLANDDCASAMEIECGDRVLVDNTTATTAITDPSFGCKAGGADQGIGTMWFSFMATDTTARVRTCGSLPPATDTILAVYDTDMCPVAGGAELACNEDAGLPCGERLSELCATGLTPGTTYLIQVASFDEMSRGYIGLEVECPCP